MTIKETAVTILNTESVSDSISSVSNKFNITGVNLLGVVVPGAFVGTQLTLSVSNDNVTYYDLYDVDNAEYTIPITKGKYNAIDPINTIQFNYMKLRAGTAASPSIQTEDISIILGLGDM